MAAIINPRTIPIPNDPRVKAEYLALGWKEFSGIFAADEPYLKWPFDLRSPMHPGQERQAPYVPPTLLSTLPEAMVNAAKSQLPPADDTDAKEVESLVLVRMKFKKKVRGGKKVSGPYYCWAADSASMEAVKEV